MSVYIEKIEIQNYRSCKKTTFSPNQNLSVLIGPNGSGKTSILKSILLLKSLLTSETNRRMNPPDESERTTIKLWLNVDGKKITHYIRLVIDTDDRNRDRIVFAEEKWNLHGITKSKGQLSFPISMFRNEFLLRAEETRHRPWVHINRVSWIYGFSSKVAKILDDKRVTNILTKVASFYEDITYYSASQFTNPALCPVSIEVEDEQTTTRGDDHKKWLFDLYFEWSKKTDGFRAFENIVGKDGINLIEKIDFKKIPISRIDYSVKIGGRVREKSKTNNLVIPQIYIGDSILSPSQLSEGTFKLLGILFYLITGKGSLILLEEPEVCIHHGLLASVISLVKSYSDEKQIFVSTHSDHILDMLDPDSVFIVRKERLEGSQVNSLKKYLSKSDLTALRKFLANEGGLGEFWRMGALDDR